ncbi:MAG: tetratricopeptide repeat protein [Lachnospiraceae bacterium]|nr:tetratricopeptide repeat protein [Lachnospiraceae bacterium]
MKKRSAYKKTGAVLAAALLFLSLSGCASPDGADPLSEGFTKISEQEYEEAVALFETAADDRPREAERGKGIALLGEGKYDEAINCFEKALSMSTGILNDMDFDLNYYLALAFYKKGNRSEAAKIYDTILSLRPEETEALYLRGVLYAESGNGEGAKEHFDRMLALMPDDYDRLISVYTVLTQNGFSEIGEEYLNDMLRKDDKKLTNYERGELFYYLGDYESARTYLEKSGEEAGPETVLLLGRIYELLGDNNYAISVFSTYLGTNDASPEILNEMGMCRIAMGDYEGALRDFRSAMELPENGLIQTLKYNEIVSLEYLGDFEGAKTLLDAYMRSFPDDERAEREAVFLSTR